ncbi:hypothetical protein PR048_013139 [Dryococelus australis]|uniref:DDE Tnp4 domain-containing protein n=1 Tax=Dryococelus australis TaxID=614101 RepID=A0ABQ9HRM7_9NEOP|nr:hypothetical protein PR048_013139 [Dryococelus australis]
MVLLAVCYSNYRFTFVDIGSYGKASDSAMYQNSILFQKLKVNALHIPSDKPIRMGGEPLPFTFVGDEAFALSTHMQRPFGGKNLSWEKVRRYIESSFGILINKWRIFHRALNINVNVAATRERDGVGFDCILSIIGLEEGDALLQSANMRFALTEKSLRSTFPAKKDLCPGRHRLMAVVAITRHQKWLVCKILRDSVVATGGRDTPPLATVAHVQAFLPLQFSLMGYYHPATDGRLSSTNFVNLGPHLVVAVSWKPQGGGGGACPHNTLYLYSHTRWPSFIQSDLYFTLIIQTPHAAPGLPSLAPLIRVHQERNACRDLPRVTSMACMSSDVSNRQCAGKGKMLTNLAIARRWAGWPSHVTVDASAELLSWSVMYTMNGKAGWSCGLYFRSVRIDSYTRDLLCIV